MLNVIDRALDEASKAAREQTEKLLNELNSATECMMAAKLTFEREMTEARKLHDLADKKQGEAVRNFDANLIQMHTVMAYLQRQLMDGEIVSGVMGEAIAQQPPQPQIAKPEKKEKEKEAVDAQQ